MASKQTLIEVMDWDSLDYMGYFIEGKVADSDVRIVLSTHAIVRLFDAALRSGVVVLECDAFYRKRGSLERWKGAKDKEITVKTTMGSR